MGEILIPYNSGGGGGVTSEDVTAVKAHILKGERTITADSDGKIVEGTMTVNSLLSFSVAAYSGRRVIAKWQNPKAAAGKPYSGIVIKGKAGAYPAWDEGDALYFGAGDNTTEEGWSQAFIDMPDLNTTYYFTAFSYASANIGDLYSPNYDPDSVKQVTCATLGVVEQTITGTQTVTVPAGYKKMDAFAVGGGGGGCGIVPGAVYRYSGGGGGGGYTKTVTSVDVSAGQALAITVGAGGAISGNGQPSTVYRDRTLLLQADGGQKGGPQSGSVERYRIDGGSGGSGGGGGIEDNVEFAGDGGADGRNGYRWGTSSTTQNVSDTSKGQGATTRAWGNPSGTLYSTGGGGGSNTSFFGLKHGNNGKPNIGGCYDNAGGNGSPNTGDGGGGSSKRKDAGAGGSGIVLIRFY